MRRVTLPWRYSVRLLSDKELGRIRSRVKPSSSKKKRVDSRIESEHTAKPESEVKARRRKSRGSKKKRVDDRIESRAECEARIGNQRSVEALSNSKKKRVDIRDWVGQIAKPKSKERLGL